MAEYYVQVENALVELGYAVSALGWDRIVLVQNVAQGGADLLPFDLRGHRVIQYELADSNARTEARALLQGRLESALRDTLKDSITAGIVSGEGAPIWWGIWKIQNTQETWGGTLFVREVGSSGFLFDLSVYSGSHTGNLTAFARFVSPNAAYARISQGEDDAVCELSFRRAQSGDFREITIEEKRWCSNFHGMGASFSGKYLRVPTRMFEYGFLDELDIQRLYSITGEHFEPLSMCVSGISREKNDELFNAAVIVGGVRGLFTIMEGIVMRGEEGQLWAAYIDGDVVGYFTTEPRYRSTLPTTIENWRQRFLDKRVEFHSHVRRVPSLYDEPLSPDELANVPARPKRRLMNAVRTRIGRLFDPKKHS